jgi:ribosome biogenesis GTPase
MKLEDLGYHSEFENFRKKQNLNSFGVGRVIAEHKERYIVKTTDKELDAEILGNLRYSAESRADFPAVGDFVAISEYDDDKALIHSVFSRTSVLERQAVGKHGEKQIIASNIDYAFIIQAVDRDFNINRIERYLTICNTSHVKPLIILNKIDLVDEENLSEMLENIEKRIKNVPVFAISNESQQGIEKLESIIEKSKTYCLLGSSGVGKSTLLNTLTDKNLMKTDGISKHSERGRHVTTHRELQILENGGIIIDNPGMREVGITDSQDGLEVTFETIIELSKKCKFNDCTHISEVGCAVLSALENGEINSSSYENYLRMEREKEHFESTVAEKRKKDKALGKIIKNYKKGKKLNKY